MEGLFYGHFPHVCKIIISYLSPISYLALRNAIPLKYCPRFIEFTYARVRRALFKRLGLDLFNDNECYLTGGFLLAVLNDDVIMQAQDVDILFRSDKFYHQTIERLDPYLYDCDEELHGYRQDVNLRIFNGTFRNTNCRIQLIRPDWIRDHVKGYDFAFCENVVSPAMVHIAHPYEVIKRSCTFSVRNYIDRYIHDDMDHVKLCCTMIERLRKYRLRGYDVQVIDNDYNDILQSLIWPNGATPRDLEIAETWSEIK